MPLLDPFQKMVFTPEQLRVKDEARIKLRSYQEPIFWSDLGILLLHWSRQIGKSYVLADWAILRLMLFPGRLVTVLSNSKFNGVEFIQKASEICAEMKIAFEQVDLSPDDRIENMRMEIRIKIAGKIGRVIVLSASPRTARGFSGDLILDEFAFHEDSVKIWDAAEPIISSNPQFACRIASTGNGRFNMFYRMSSVASAFMVSRVRRSDAYQLGVKIYDPATRREITPAEARAASIDKASYDQNYECAFADENMALLTIDAISACEYGDSENECRIESQDFSRDTLEFLRSLTGPLVVGLDVGRERDLTVAAIGERVGGVLLTRAILRISAMRLPDQLKRLEEIFRMQNFGRLSGDATGLGLGLIEFAQEIAGQHRVEAVQFASREKRIVRGIQQSDSALVTELMALDLMNEFESRSIRIPCEMELRDSLRKPERIQTGNGVRIAATRDEAGHADEFWAMALMVRASKSGFVPFAYRSITPNRRGGNNSAEMHRTQRKVMI